MTQSSNFKLRQKKNFIRINLDRLFIEMKKNKGKQRK